MHDEKFKRVATPHTVTKSKRPRAAPSVGPRCLTKALSSPLTNSKTKADMYQFETRARHMYRNPSSGHVNQGRSRARGSRRRRRRSRGAPRRRPTYPTGGALPLTLLFLRCVKTTAARERPILLSLPRINVPRRERGYRASVYTNDSRITVLPARGSVLPRIASYSVSASRSKRHPPFDGALESLST